MRGSKRVVSRAIWKKRYLGRNDVPHTPTVHFPPKVALLTAPILGEESSQPSAKVAYE